MLSQLPYRWVPRPASGRGLSFRERDSYKPATRRTADCRVFHVKLTEGVEMCLLHSSKKHSHPPAAEPCEKLLLLLLLLLSWCLMSSDVIWHIRDKLWPMPKHGSIRKVYACLAVTCHLHFWQNDRDFLRATVVTRGWNGYRNKSQHRKSTLEKKILPPFQQGFEPATFQSRVRRSNHWAIPAPLSEKLSQMIWFYRRRRDSMQWCMAACFGKTRYKKLCTHAESHASVVGLLESGE